MSYLPSAAFGAAAGASACDVLLVAGGVYGNVSALEALCELVRAERLAAPGRRVACVLNGDWHWLDADAEAFAAVQRLASPFVLTRGNVETEVAAADGVGGCGCNYPASVARAEAERSDAIAARLRVAARSALSPEAVAALGALPMTAVAEVGGLRVGIAHGDAESLAGWGFAHDALDAPGAGARVDRLFAEAGVDVFAVTHTCLPVLRLAPCGGVVVNNGAAGMPNFAGSAFGVVTRISRAPVPPALRLYGCELRGVHIDALRLDYDAEVFARQFLRTWPEGSPAHVSYWSRICGGPRYTIEQASPRAMGEAPAAAATAAALPHEITPPREALCVRNPGGSYEPC